jgi:hypothetical protein
VFPLVQYFTRNYLIIWRLCTFVEITWFLFLKKMMMTQRTMQDTGCRGQPRKKVESSNVDKSAIVVVLLVQHQ